jgi:hypothetical protein
MRKIIHQPPAEMAQPAREAPQRCAEQIRRKGDLALPRLNKAMQTL